MGAAGGLLVSCTYRTRRGQNGAVTERPAFTLLSPRRPSEEAPSRSHEWTGRSAAGEPGPLPQARLPRALDQLSPSPPRNPEQEERGRVPMPAGVPGSGRPQRDPQTRARSGQGRAAQGAAQGPPGSSPRRRTAALTHPLITHTDFLFLSFLFLQGNTRKLVSSNYGH